MSSHFLFLQIANSSIYYFLILFYHHKCNVGKCGNATRTVDKNPDCRYFFSSNQYACSMNHWSKTFSGR
jgi:hypothetical protein